MTDEDRAAYRRRRMAELLAEAEENVTRTRAAREQPPTETGSWWNTALGVVVLLVFSFVVTAAAMTIGRFTGFDFADARRTGTATVERCDRRGPVSFKGFGYWQQCTVSIAWNGGPASRVLIDKPGFFTNQKPGDTFQIGEHTGSRGSVGYARPELPDRGWVTAIGLVLWFIGFLPALAVFVVLYQAVKDRFRRRHQQ